MPEARYLAPEEDRAFHTYETHPIPWYIRLMWVGFGVGTICCVVRFAIPGAKNHF